MCPPELVSSAGFGLPARSLLSGSLSEPARQPCAPPPRPQSAVLQSPSLLPAQEFALSLCLSPVAATGCNENEAEHLDRDQPPYPPSQKTKRMRTSFKHHQLRTMKSYFAINHNPDAKDLKQLAQKTGLTKRVLQVRRRRGARRPSPCRSNSSRPCREWSRHFLCRVSR